MKKETVGIEVAELIEWLASLGAKITSDCTLDCAEVQDGILILTFQDYYITNGRIYSQATEEEIL